jgi:acid phosphatase
VVVDRLLRYHDYGEYDEAIREVTNSARDYLDTITPGGPGTAKPAAVFDIDETSLSNWESMAACGFCAYSVQTKLYSNAHDPAIVPVLELFDFAKARGIAPFFVTGRKEHERDVTTGSLTEAGFSGWVKLFMQADDNTLPASVVKPRNRQEIQKMGYRIVLNIGDQASDLAGCCAERVFKLPNPFYLVK